MSLNHVSQHVVSQHMLGAAVVPTSGVDVQLLVVTDCPNERPAAALLRQALDDLGLTTVPVTTRIVTDQAQAEVLGFAGSPTILIDGRDPFADPTHTPGLACRLYIGDSGLSGVPPLVPLRRALKQAVAGD